MIKRVWRGWTTPEQGDAYQRILINDVIPLIESKSIPGYISIEVLREDIGNEIEFSTIMTFTSIDSVIAFQGEDYARSHIPDIARKVLKRWDETCRHYDIISKFDY